MTVIPIPTLGHDRVGYIRRLMTEGYALLEGSRHDFVEGSLKLAEALRAARDDWPANIAFSKWLKDNKLDVLHHNDRAALVNMAINMDLARAVLTETEHKSYKAIWEQNKKRFTRPGKTPRKRRSQRRKKGSVNLFREMKLGTDVMNKIKGTSLDSAYEMDELIMLNRGAAPGEQTPVVARLVEDAAAGKLVSAVATGGAHKIPPVLDALRKRMSAPWLRASLAERKAVIAFLQDHLEDKL